MNKIKILGIDPGTAIVGWGIIEKKLGNIEMIDCGQITTSPKLKMSERLNLIADELIKIIKRYQPNEIAVEELFYFKNKKTVISVAQARGVILYICKKEKKEIGEYTPLQIKQALTGYGRANKKQIQLTIKNILHLKKIPKPDDIADALAVAFCHLNSRNYKQKINESKKY
jgi:crossover junction endodeoxyribonuclease RuvC